MSVCDDILAPFDRARFFDEHWGRKAAFIKGTPGKFRTLYDVDGDRWIAHATELEAAAHDARGGQHQVRIAPQDVHAHFAKGMTICANVTLDPALTPTLRSLAHELQLGGAPFAKIYASPDRHGFALHLDSFHVFVCQLVGRKHWRFSATPAVEAPIYSGKVDVDGQPVWSDPRDGEAITDDDGVPIAPPVVSELDACELGPGDCLYLPPGTWHVARAVGRSIALSISPPRTPILELVTKTLEDHLTMRAAWRRDVPAMGSPEAVPASVVQAFRERLDDLRRTLDELDPRTLHRVWRINASAHGPAEIRAEVPLSADMRLRHVGDAVRRYLVAPATPGGSDAIHFYAGGAEWSLPIEALTFVRGVAEHETFSVVAASAFDTTLDESDVAEILEQLVAAGLLEPVTTVPAASEPS
jgi:50S ribosomal protein L16 3-hydroxylase